MVSKSDQALGFLTCKASNASDRLWVTVFFGFIASEVKLQERGYDFCVARWFI
jgi:hypothetical protein